MILSCTFCMAFWVIVSSHVTERLLSIAEPQHLSPPLSSLHSPCNQMIQSSTPYKFRPGYSSANEIHQGTRRVEIRLAFPVIERRRRRATSLPHIEPWLLKNPGGSLFQATSVPNPVIGPLIHGSANQKPTILLSRRHAVCTRTCSTPVGAPRETRRAYTPVEKSQCEWTMLRPSNSRIQMRSPNFCRGSTPRYRSSPQYSSPADQQNFPVQRNQSHLSCSAHGLGSRPK